MSFIKYLAACCGPSCRWLSLTAIFIVSGILLGSETMRAQNSSPNVYFETLAQADAKLGAKQWTEAAALFELLVKANPVEGRSWNRLGFAYYNAKEYRKSIPAYENQIELGFGILSNVAYNIACDYALLGEKESAIRWLEKAFAMGFPNLKNAQTDTDLQLLRDDPRYRTLVGLIDTGKMSREEGWRADLQFLSREIRRRGYYLFPRTGTEADFDAAVKKINDSIPQLTDVQVLVEFLKLMRRIGDGHSGMVGAILRAEYLQNLPVQFYLFEEGLFVISADPKYKDLLGAQILKFGDRTPDEIIKGLEPIIHRDNEMGIKNFAPYQMRSLILLNGLALIPDAGKVSLTIRDLEGKERIVTLVPDATQPFIWNVLPNPRSWTNLSQTLPGPAPLYMKNPAAPYWFEYMPDSKTVYFGFNSVLNDPNESLADFASRLFKFIGENDVEKLAIDMRWNNGGNTNLLKPLVEGLIKSEKINRQGKLFVIIGRRTFSAAQNATTYFERYTNAIFVGEPTGSSPNFVGEERPFTLPYSRLVMNVSDLYWESAFPWDKRIWIAPQIYLPPTFEAYRANRDAALEAILNYKQKTN